MDEKMSEAEREFEEWCKEEYPDSVDLAIRLIPARKAYLAAAARYLGYLDDALYATILSILAPAGLVTAAVHKP